MAHRLLELAMEAAQQPRAEIRYIFRADYLATLHTHAQASLTRSTNAPELLLQQAVASLLKLSSSPSRTTSTSLSPQPDPRGASRQPEVGPTSFFDSPGRPCGCSDCLQRGYFHQSSAVPDASFGSYSAQRWTQVASTGGYQPGPGVPYAPISPTEGFQADSRSPPDIILLDPEDLLPKRWQFPESYVRA